MRWRTRFFCASGLILIAGLATGSAQEKIVAKPDLVGRRAPGILRKDFNGQTISLEKLRGKVVLLNFWASWCGPCLKEMPQFDEWTLKFGEPNFTVLGISIDDEKAAAKKAIEKLQIHYPVAMGDAGLGNAYGGVLGVPISFLIDRKGVIRARYEGEIDIRVIEKKVQELVKP